MAEKVEGSENGGDSVCDVCKKKFKNEEKLSLHMRFHSLFGNFKKTPASQDGISEEGAKQASAAVDSPALATKPKSRSASSILLVEKPFRCTKCGVNFSSMRNKIQHDLLHAKKTSGFEQRGAYTSELKCSICKKKCRTENGLQKHFETEHTDLHEAQNNVCKTCTKKFKNKEALDSHIQSVHVEEKAEKQTSSAAKPKQPLYRKPNWFDYEAVIVESKGKGRALQMYKCKLCDTHCFTVRSIRVHLKKDHRKEKIVATKCKECGKVFAEEASLRRHLTIVHKKGKLEVANGAGSCRESNETGESNANDIAANQEGSTPVKVPSTTKSGTTDEEVYRCDECNLSFTTALQMMRHLKKHSKQSQRQFTSLMKGYRRFRSGYNSNSGDLKYIYKCVHCKKTAMKLNDIVNHVKDEHTSPNKNAGKDLNMNDIDDGEEDLLLKSDKNQGNGLMNANLSADEGKKSPSKQNGPKAPESKSKQSQIGRRKIRCWFKPKKVKRKAKRDDPCHCLECGVVLTTEWELSHHYETQHSGPNYQVVPKYTAANGKYNLFLKCLICGKMCRSKSRLKKHLREHEKKGEKPQMVNSGPNGAISPNKKPAKGKGSSPQKGGCIYHCSACGESFPWLFNYSEHKCNVKGLLDEEIDEPSAKKEKLTTVSREKSDTKMHNQSLDENLETETRKRKLSAKSEQIEFDDVRSEIEKKVLVTPRLDGRSGSVVTLKRSPWAALNTGASDADNSMKRKNSSIKFQCRYCKRPFPNEKQLVKHETMHTEANLFSCSNCGMSFTAMHKLRYHSVRCIQNRETKRKRLNTTDNYQVLGDESFNGCVNGNTYPSYARKSEYTVFDPANRPEDYEDNLNVFYNGIASPETGSALPPIKPANMGSKGSLDDIIIADVRSCNPAFIADKHFTDSKDNIKYSPTAANIQQRGAFTPADVAPGYYMDPAQGGFANVDGINVVSPEGLQQGMYTQGTVLLVPYFVPAQESFPKGGQLLTGAIAPKPASLPAGSFLMNPNDFNARISPRFYSPVYQNKPPVQTESNLEVNNNSSKPNTPIGIGEKPTKRIKNCESSPYNCSVCEETFSTFGNYVKHRESHKV